jgi:hypothetical protein
VLGVGSRHSKVEHLQGWQHNRWPALSLRWTRGWGLVWDWAGGTTAETSRHEISMGLATVEATGVGCGEGGWSWVNVGIEVGVRVPEVGSMHQFFQSVVKFRFQWL